MENPALEPRSERIARYKAERRRELAERYGNMEELPTKCVRRDGKDAHEDAPLTHTAVQNSDGPTQPRSERTLSGGVNGKTGGSEGSRRGSDPQRVSNGFEADADAESTKLRR